MDEKLILYLENFQTDRRKAVFEQVLDFRTRYITVVMEDIYQPNNASAVLRSCDCFGVQDVHIIENNNQYVVDREVSMGSHKWLNIIKYKDSGNNTAASLEELKKKDYRIIATTPHAKESSLRDFDLTKGRIALVFGTELTGLSKTAMELADEFLRIPMFGFTESFNLSVSAAIILENLTHKLHESDLDWHLTRQERMQIKLDWLRKSIKDSARIEKKFLANEKNV